MSQFVRIVAALTLLWIAGVAHAQEPLWVGTFVNEEQSDEAVQAAIETAVAKMNFITRSVARGRLKKTNPAYKRVVIARNDDRISVSFDQRKPIEMPADGSPIKWTREDGEVFEVTAQPSEAELVQTFRAEDGQRVNTFTADQAGQMTLKVEITSPQLPAPLIYTLQYRRAPQQ